MSVLKRLLVLSTLMVTGAACGESDGEYREALRRLDEKDLAVGGVVSPVELGMDSLAPAAPAPAVRVVSAGATTRTARSTSVRRTTQRSSSSGTVAREPRVVTETNTKRDAAIGAGAGAIIGAVAAGSGNRAKGAIIGAAAGGAIGAVIGAKVDTKKRVEH